jgi:AcrR family transcriptional regulator
MIHNERSSANCGEQDLPTAAQRRSEARERLLRTASGLFYTKGVHAVGVDEIISRARVTRATFYRHFPSKDDLIVEYIRTVDQHIRDAVAAALENPTSPDFGVRAIADYVASQIKTPGFRGCAFLNAAAEYPVAEDPIHQAVLAHRTWFYETVRDQFSRVSDRSEQAAKHFVMLRDGAMAEGCLTDADNTIATFLRGIDGMLVLGPHRND